MKILVMNCGSSSLKYQLIDVENKSVFTKGLCGRVGIDNSLLTHTPTGGEKYRVETVISSHKETIKFVMQALVDPSHDVIKNTDEISAIGHRVVHDGTCYNESVLVDEGTKKAIVDYFDLVPLHNPTNLMGIEVCEAAMSGKPNVAVFDTAFDMSMPEKVYLHALPYEHYEKYRVRRYGFHGTGHNFVTSEVIREDGLDPKGAGVVVRHLGNDASISASIDGRCVDTPMGFTPLRGLIIGTRSGGIGPAVIRFICEHEKLMVEEMTDVLNKKSGILGLSNGISFDFRSIDDAANGGNHLAKVALEAYTLRVAECIDAYVTAMNGVDVTAFTTDVGENDKFMGKNICAYLGYLGVKIDDKRSDVRDEERLISTGGSRVQVYLLPTNEELAITRDTLGLTE